MHEDPILKPSIVQAQVPCSHYFSQKDEDTQLLSPQPPTCGKAGTDSAACEHRTWEQPDPQGLRLLSPITWWSSKEKTRVTVMLKLHFLTVQSLLFLKPRFSNILNKIQGQVLLTRFSTSLSSSRNLSSSFTHCGNSFSPWLWACSSCSFSSLSTEISWTSRSCQVFEACKSSSRSSEVRIRRSVPKDLIEGWKRRRCVKTVMRTVLTTLHKTAQYIMRPIFSTLLLAQSISIDQKTISLAARHQYSGGISVLAITTGTWGHGVTWSHHNRVTWASETPSSSPSTPAPHI